MITEADTCRRYVLPKLYSPGWNDDQINEQKTFTDGRIAVTGDKYINRKKKRSDFLLKIRRDFSIAVVEAKSAPIKYTDYTQKQVRSMYTSASELHSKWSNAEQREQIVSLLAQKGITIEQLDLEERADRRDYAGD